MLVKRLECMGGLAVIAALFLGLGDSAVADLVEQGPKDSKPSGLLAGVARANITPAMGISQMNWGSATHIEADGLDPVGMYPTALVLTDGKQKLAMVEIDVVVLGAWTESSSARLPERASRQLTYGWERRTLMPVLRSLRARSRGSGSKSVSPH